MRKDRRSAARGCLLGLAIGDALGGPTEGKTPKAIAAEWGRVTDFLSETQTGSDDTEYALFNTRLLLKHGANIDAGMIARAWLTEIVSSTNTYNGAGFSEMMAIRNLKAGLLPPHSGDHAHSWSDGLAMRVAPFGIVMAGRPAAAAELARRDGSVTHSGEGILSGQAVAAAVAIAMEGAAIADIIDAARGVTPPDSWTRRGIDRATSIAGRYSDVWSALGPLYQDIVCSSYFWPDIAPEAVSLAFGILDASHGNFEEAVLGGVNVGRDTDTIAGIAGAILGAQLGEEALPEKWIKRVAVSRGVCLAAVRGMQVGPIADQLVELADMGESHDRL
jgi:ADP-ribosylglycohydrolase